MDCRRALEVLDVAGIDSNMTSEAALEAARAHLESCRRCEETLQSRSKFDAQIGQAMRDVQVPSTLKQRLLKSAADQEAIALEQWDELTSTNVEIDLLRDLEKAKNSSQPRDQPWRRRWLVFSLTAACLCVAVGWLIVQTLSPSITLAEIHEMLPAAAAGQLPKFDGNFSTKPPKRGWEGLLSGNQVMGLRSEDSGKHLMAVYKFRFRNSQRSFVSGLLFATPVDEVTDAPGDQFFARGSVVYLSDDSATVAWVSEGMLYVCWLPPGGGHDLRSLERALEGAPA